MLVSSSIASSATRSSSSPAGSPPDAVSVSDEPNDCFEPSRKDGALRGLITGVATGTIVDTALLGAPAVIGYLNSGLQGAVVGILALPVACGVLCAIDCALNPEAYVKEDWASLFGR